MTRRFYGDYWQLSWHLEQPDAGQRNTCTSNCIRAASRSGKRRGERKCRRRGSDRDICGLSVQKDDGKTYTIRIAIVSSDSHLHNTVLNEWAQEAKEKTNGRLNLKVMGSSQLGGERDYVEGMQLGNIEMAQVSSAAVNGFLNDFSAVISVFFKDYAEMEKVFNGPMGDELFAELEGIGIKGLYMVFEWF